MREPVVTLTEVLAGPPEPPSMTAATAPLATISAITRPINHRFAEPCPIPDIAAVRDEPVAVPPERQNSAPAGTESAAAAPLEIAAALAVGS